MPDADKRMTARRSPRAHQSQVFHLKEIVKRRAGHYSFVLEVPQLTVRRGEKLALVGISGCGKSTLLDVLAMVLRPDEGVMFAFQPGPEDHVDVIEAWKSKNLDLLARARMHHMGYVLQTGGLLPFLSVWENINLCRRALGMPHDDVVEILAERLGIQHHLKKLPGQLSVGERQRVAIARAMAHGPSVVMADEPTASLDPLNAAEIMTLFMELADEKHVTLIVATHDWEQVANLGFRRVEFDLTRNSTENAVRATVCGQT